MKEDYDDTVVQSFLTENGQLVMGCQRTPILTGDIALTFPNYGAGSTP
jgi:hypothetical protein